jgi:hypothetical protein
MQTIACEMPTTQPETMSQHVREMRLAEWMESKPAGTFISTSTGYAWQKCQADGFYYVAGCDAGYNVECVAIEGPFVFVGFPGGRK